jgi:hypothetical protein
MGGLKLQDLNWGMLNELSDSNQHQLTGDRRRTGTTNMLQQAAALAYSPDAVGTRDEYHGFIVSHRPTNYATYQNPGSMLQEYVILTNFTAPAGQDDAQQKAGRYNNLAYKVYIPALNPQPAPRGADDPVLRSYPDIYSSLPGKQALPLGSLVVVRFDDPAFLRQPSIVRVVEMGIGLENISVDKEGKVLATAFYQGQVPTALGSIPGVQQLGHGTDDKYENYTIETTTRKKTVDEGNRYPKAKFYSSYNFSQGASDRDSKIKWIIIHTTEMGGTTGALNVLSGYRKSTGEMYKRKASTQYFVNKQGEVYNLVPDNHKAWHVGTKKRVNDTNSIGIEHEGWAADPNNWTPAMVTATAGLIKYLTDKYKIPLVYEGLGPRRYATNSKGHPSLSDPPPDKTNYPEGTGVQENLPSGLIAHAKARDPNMGKYDPGVYFPYEEVIAKASV